MIDSVAYLVGINFGSFIKGYDFGELPYGKVKQGMNDFIKAWKALQSFRGDSSPSTWLWRIATNEALSFLRKQKVRAALRFESIGAEVERLVASDPWFDGDEAQRRLVVAVASLPDKQRAVFCMRYFEEMPYEQISEITGTSVGALKATYHIASGKIAESVQLDGD